MQIPQLTVELLVAGIASLAAIAAAIFAWRSAKVAQRTLELSEHDHRERHAGLTAYLIDGVIWDDDGRDRLVAFACSVSNTASAPLSVTRGDLHVHAFGSDGTTTEVVLLPDAAGAPSIWNLKPLNVPLNLNARTTESGWVGYRIPARVVESLSIDRYELVFISSSGERASVTQHLLQRISNATRKT